MRALRKIVFVNSAHIRYAEVKLNGNVHFIGTQGVGKSTLLRAVLFFYNADKQHLGIPKEMKTFDEFYLPNANSYIVYEVEHEHGPFSILVFRSSGRACFRFVEAPYSQKWLVDDQGEVTADGKVIRERLNGAYMSRIVDRYEQYRDILYGNRQAAVGREFKRFSLMESSSYQNIPRSIQNVFLNSRLDAGFIKDIIIKSMGDDESKIDIEYFRGQVSDFEQQYRDIACWGKLNAKGQPVVKVQAETAVNAYHELANGKRHIGELCGNLNYCLRVARERLPEVERQTAELNTELARQHRLLGEEQKKHDDEKSKLNQAQGVANDKLKRLKSRRDYYESRHMGDVLKRFEMEPVLKSRLDSLNGQLGDLTARFNDISSKYASLTQKLELQFEAESHKLNSQILALEADKQRAAERLMADCASEKAEADTAFAGKLDDARAAIDDAKAAIGECDKELVRLNFFEPFKDDKEAIKAEMDKMRLRENELKGKISVCEAQMSRIQAEYDRLEAGTVADFNRQKDDKRQEAEATRQKIAETDELLGSIGGSLYEWLEENKSGWEQSIGKVIDDKTVLYSTGLDPRAADDDGGGSSLFGVQLNLSALPMNVRRPQELKQERARLEKQLGQIEAEIAAIGQRQEKAVDDLKRKYAPKVKEQRSLRAECDAELHTLPQKVKAKQIQLDDLERRAQQYLAERRHEQAEKKREFSKRLDQAKAEMDKLAAEKLKRVKAIDKKYAEARREAERQCTQRTAEIRAEIERLRLGADAEKLKLQQRELEELKGQGANTAMVEECRGKIEAVQAELKYIDGVRSLVYDYQRDKADLFDREQEIRGEAKALQSKLEQLEEKYRLRRQKLDGHIATLGKQLGTLNEESSHLQADLQKAEAFTADAKLCPPSLGTEQERPTSSTLGETVDELKNEIILSQSRFDRLKRSVNVFKANFSAKNTFNFRTELDSEADYTDFADNLEDFLINDKIDEYRSRTSARYVDILNRLSNEMGELSRHESDVDKIILDINRDFRERNFVGVIKQISIRNVPSSDKMVQLLRHIKEFSDNNAFAMGEMNLFSTSNRDEVNRKAVDHLLDFMKALNDEPQRNELSLSDLFQLQFRIVENDNDTGWADKLSHVGSEGTDTLVKAMINIMLINVFKDKACRRFGDFRIHCMMDEIGKLHPQNVKGILDFANARNILLINSSPTTYNVSDYRYTYLLSKDAKSQTVVHQLISRQQ